MQYKIKYHTIELSDNLNSVSSPLQVVKAVRDEMDLSEGLWVFGLDSQNKPRVQKLVAKGGSSSISCELVFLFAPLMHCCLNRMLIVHNHPSGDTNPSKEDIEFTNRVKGACKIMNMQLVDHLIVSHKDFYSFVQNGLV